jgi:hypothetical protein
MKKIHIILFIVLLVTVAAFKVSAQTEQTRQVSNFNGIASSGPFNIRVKIDGTESLKITANADIINEIETVVENGKLEIKFKRSHGWEHNNVGKVDVYVTAKSLSTIANAGSGNIKVDGTLRGDEVKLVVSGSASITTAVKSEALRTVISGSGSININGNSNNTNIVISGSGELKGKEFKTGSASVVITGSGNAYITADKTLSAHIVGSGSLVYAGNATVSDVKTVGSGSVTKAGQ